MIMNVDKSLPWYEWIINQGYLQSCGTTVLCWVGWYCFSYRISLWKYRVRKIYVTEHIVICLPIHKMPWHLKTFTFSERFLLTFDSSFRTIHFILAYLDFNVLTLNWKIEAKLFLARSIISLYLTFTYFIARKNTFTLGKGKLWKQSTFS